jgi:hypothetical protein
LYIEISLRPDRQHDIPALVQQTIDSLKQTGILNADDRIVAQYPILLPYAYVVYNRSRKKAVERIHRYLLARNVHSFGRYGSWVYSSMEDAILEGKQYAEQLALS